MAHKKFNSLTLFLIYSCFFTTSIIVSKSNSKAASKKSKIWGIFKPRSRKKERKNKNVVPHGHIHIDKMNEDQLKEVYDHISHQVKPDPYFMVKVLTRLINVSANHAASQPYKLKLADLHYELHHLEIASDLYKKYEDQYPSSKEAEYCLYKSVLCMFNISLDPDRNQVHTEKALQLAKDFLSKATNQEFKEEVTAIKNRCYEKLYEKEVYVLRFYLKKKKYGAVQIRLNYIEKNFAKVIPNFAKKLANLKEEIANYKKGISPSSTTKKTTKLSRKKRLLG